MLLQPFNLLKTTIVAPPSNANKWQMGFHSAFKGLISLPEVGVFFFIIFRCRYLYLNLYIYHSFPLVP